MKTIQEMAREAEAYISATEDFVGWSFTNEQLEAFAALVREEERKKFCAVLRQLHDSYSLASNPAQFKEQFWQMTESKENK